MITLKHINKRYLHQRVLIDVNMSFPSKGFVSIVGPSGCGKSTLLNVIGGIDCEYHGQVYLHGQVVKDLSKKLRVTMIFQSYHLIHYLSNRHNIHLYDDFHPTRFTDFHQNLIQQFYKLPVSKLSLGQRQRVAILRALYPEPDVILCDEPTASLDEANKVMVMRFLKELSQNALVIFVSHDHKLVEEYSDYIYTMEDGEITNTIQYDKVDKAIVKLDHHFHPFAIFKLALLGFKSQKKRFLQMCFYLGLALVSIMLVFTLSFSLRHAIIDYIESVLPKSTISFQNINDIKMTKNSSIQHVFHYVDGVELLGLSENRERYMKNEALFINDETGYTNKIHYGRLIKENHEIILPYNTARKLAGNQHVEKLLGKHFYAYYKYRNLVKGVEMKVVGISQERLSYDAFYQAQDANLMHMKALFGDQLQTKLGILYYKGDGKKVLKTLQKQNPRIQFKLVGEKTKQNMNKTIDRIEFILFLFALIAIMSSCFIIGEMMYLFVESHMKDYAIEYAYGARRIQLFKQLFYSIMLVIGVSSLLSIGALQGLLVSMNHIVLPKLFESSFHVTIPISLLVMTLLGAIILVLISALASFIRMSRFNVAEVMKQ